MADFEKATRPEPTDTAGLWNVRLDEQWCIGEKLHGGYLVAVLARAAVAAVDGKHDTPQGVTATFYAAPEPGPCEVTVEIVRSGRSVSQVRTRLVQGDVASVDAVVVLGTAPGPDDGSDANVSAPPEPVAPRSECWRSPAERDDGRGSLPIMEVVDTRLDPDTTGFAVGNPAGRGRIAGWTEQADGQPWTATSLLVALDILPPASFDLGLSGWSPTMTFAAALHGTPAPGPARVVQWVDHLGGDRMVESCRVWDAEGRCVGQATQLAAVRR